MDLATYLTKEKISADEFARLLGKPSAKGIQKWLRKERTPRPDEQRKIFEATKGKVTPNDFVLKGAA